MLRRLPALVSALSSFVVAASFLSGCGVADLAPASPLAVSAGELHGSAHGGLQPVVGGKVYLLESTTSGYGGLSKSLLTSATGSTADTIGYSVQTSSSGGFSISGDYTCDAGSVVYLLVKGGNPGAGTNNSLGLMSTLGVCPSSAPYTFAATVPFLYVNEVTTVATAYALSGFAIDATHVGATANPKAILGLQNAAGNFTNLANVATGTARSVMPTNGTGVVPTALLNTLANIISVCVNSASTAPANCNTLFSNTLSGGTTGTTPTDTATAAINLAHNLWVSNARVTALYGLQPGIGAAYAPNLTSAPTDFAVGLTIPTGNVDLEQIAFDGNGTAWVTTSNGIQLISALGAPGVAISQSAPLGIAIDHLGRGWATNDSSIAAYTAAGVALPGSPFTQSGTTTTGANFSSVAVDKNGNIWAGNRSVYIFTPTGAAASFSPIAEAGHNPGGIAVDSTGSIWTNDQTNRLYSYSSAGVALTSVPYTCGQIGLLLAFDATDNAWLTTYGGLCKESESGTTAAGFPYTAGPYGTLPEAIALDGASQAWGASTILFHLANDGSALSPAGGLGAVYGVMNFIAGLAPDGSGNLWYTPVKTATGPASLVELVGASTPVVTPIVDNLLAPYGSAAVNKP